MTIEQKKEALRNAAAEGLSSIYELYRWKKVEDNEGVFVLSGECGSEVRKAYLAGCRDAWGGEIYIDYNPEEDLVGIYIKERPIHAKFKDDILSIFMKHSPFDMNLSFDEEMTPILSRKSKVEPKDFLEYLKEFRRAYDEYYPLFYMISVCAVKWYDGFHIGATYCVDGVYY